MPGKERCQNCGQVHDDRAIMTGFVVASDPELGVLVVTNSHFVRDAEPEGKLGSNSLASAPLRAAKAVVSPTRVRDQQLPDTLPIQLVSEDTLADAAVFHVAPSIWRPKASRLGAVNPGTVVMNFSFPRGAKVLNFATFRAVGENAGTLWLDKKPLEGMSGSPIISPDGEVVGMVSGATIHSNPNEPHGVAVPASVIASLLRESAARQANEFPILNRFREANSPVQANEGKESNDATVEKLPRLPVRPGTR